MMTTEGMFEGVDDLPLAPFRVRREHAAHAREARDRWGQGDAYAESVRLRITRWFYPSSAEMHAGLADLYGSDPRFRAHYEKRASGLAALVARAIRANAPARGAEG